MLFISQSVFFSNKDYVISQEFIRSAKFGERYRRINENYYETQMKQNY
jgi:hypothetical protein